MPALKMKTKSNTDCVGGHSLHACRKSIKLSKGSHSQVKSSPQAERWHTTFENLWDVPPNKELSDQNIYDAEANNCQEAVARNPVQLSMWSSPSCDPKFIERMGSESARCASITETIFSPLLKDNNNRDEHTELPHLVADDSDDGSCSSTDLQAFPASDFYAFESLTSLSFEGEMGFSDMLTNFEPDYEHVDTDLMFDMSDRCMIMPFHEKTIESNDIQDRASTDESVINSDDSCLYLAIHQIKSSDQESGMSRTGDLEEVECFDPQLFFRSLPDLSEAVSSMCPALLSKESRQRKPITLVLDLDETLVHSTLDYCEDADFTFPVFFNMKQHIVYVKRRPYLQVFLERVAQMFEIVIFTASQSIYAEQLLDILDPDRKLISQRIYRESCIFSDGTYTKDLTILGVDLAKVAIIDNSPQVFRLQVNNGIPIRSWFDDPSDHALISLLPFLETLVDADDVRPIIAKKFGNKEEEA